ncbi:hypothetical protein CISIN_1g0171712mg, partial [Citrus sinensis]
LKLKLKPLQI